MLFISSTVAFAAGSSLVQACFSKGATSSGTLFAGVFLEWYTALAVTAIGISLFPVLKPHGKYLSVGYLLLRAVEGMAIIATRAYFLTSHSQFEKYDLLVYILSGAAGLFLSYLLLRSGMVAKWLSLLGAAGYAALLAGVPAEALGAIDLDSGAGAVFLVPGGLFEVVLPLLLIITADSAPLRARPPQLPGLPRPHRSHDLLQASPATHHTEHGFTYLRGARCGCTSLRGPVRGAWRGVSGRSCAGR